MKLRLLILGLCTALVVPAFAQQTEVDVTKLLADTKTFIFSNNKNTVKTYIYEEMEGKTSCCGNDRIYLEIKIDPSGYVLQAKTLTGKNDCYKKSAIDIVKNIKWDAKGFKGPKSVYFEIKPEIECEEARTNTYAALPLFNNEVLDENGVPLSYASSTGVSASSASGVSTTPTGVPATPVNPRPSTAGAGNQAGGAAGAGETETAVANQPAGTKPAVDAGGAAGGAGSDVSEPMASNTKPGTTKPNTAANTSDSELEKAKTMAKMEQAQQDDEIEKLRKELEQMKELEKQRAEKESEKARREEAAKERERILALQKEKDARAKREQEERESARTRETERPVASNDRGSQGGFRDVDYSDNGGNNSSSGGGYDYSDSRGKSETDPPPRAKTPAERAAEEKARLDRELEELKRKQQDFERDERARLADKERTAKDIARLQEQILRKAEEERKAKEREDLERIEAQRREADQRKRDMEQAVQRKMDELKRMQMDMDRQLADLKRLEEEAKRKEEEKLQREQEITAEQQIRQQQMEAEIERQKLMAGSGSGVTTARGMTPMPVFTGSGSDSLSGSSIAFLAAQIEQLRLDILGLQNAIGGGGTTRISQSPVNNSPRNRTTGAPATASGEKSAVTDKSWRGTDYKEEGVYYPTTASAAPGGDLRPDPSHAGTHANVSIAPVGAPTYPGGLKAMNSVIADKLLAAGICGIAEATFELEVNGQGNVASHRILSVGTPDMQFQLPAILQSLKFEPSNSRFNQSLFSIFKAEIACNTPEAPKPATEMPESTDQ